MSDNQPSPKRTQDFSLKGPTSDPLWPVTVVLLILAVCVGCVIIAKADFGIEGLLPSLKRVASNGFVQMIALLLLLVGLIWSAARAKNSLYLRRMQFSAGLGLLLHVFLLTGLQYADQYIPAGSLKKNPTRPRPFKIVSLPSDGRRLTQRIHDQGLARPVETDSRSESNPVERLTQQPNEPIPESARSSPEMEPAATPEVSTPNVSRAETATRPGQPTAAQLDRQQLSQSLPNLEAAGAPTLPADPPDAPQTDAQISSERQQADMQIGGGGQLGVSPDMAARSRRSDPTRRFVDDGHVPMTSPQPSPARSSNAPADLQTPQVVETIPGATGVPARSSLEPANTNVRGQTGAPSVNNSRSAESLTGEPGMSRGGAIQPRVARRADAPGTSGSAPGRVAPTTPFSQRNPIVLAPGGGSGTGIENESVVVGSGSQVNRGSELGPEFNAPIGSGRQTGGIPSRGSNDRLAGAGGTGTTGVGTGRGLSGTGTGPSTAGRTAPQTGNGSQYSLGKSNSVGLPGNIDGEEEGPRPGDLARNSRGAGSTGGGIGDGLPALGPGGSGRASSGSRRPSALPGLGSGSGGGSGGGTGSGIGTGTGSGSGLAGIRGGAGTGSGTGVGGGAGGAGGGNSTGIGAGGLGLPSRRARPQSESIADTGRFILNKSDVGPSLDARADPAPAFRQRGRAGRGRLAEGLGGNAESEQAVELGLQFLKSVQFGDGHWSLHDFAAGRSDFQQAGEGTMDANTAGTGLALLAFLGAGYSHYDDPHRATVTDGVHYLVRNQKPNGDLFSGGSPNTWFYSHGIAAIALCEAYGMTRDEKLRQPAQRALDFIIASQDPRLGGWRYSPQAGSDTSVSGWQMMALKSGELAGLKVPSSAYAGVTKWLNSSQAENNPSQYIYRPGSQYEHQRTPSRAMTAEALLMRLYLGWDRSNPNLIQGADYLRENLPQFGRRDLPLRDAYYWYYATQVMFQMQGDHWQAWNERLRPLLVDSQVGDGPFAGSWNPGGTIPDRWAETGGRIYLTAMHLLMLEVYYRHLPLYQTLTPDTKAQ